MAFFGSHHFCMDETILYEDSDIIVTNTRIKVGGDTHSLHGVTEIKTSSQVKDEKDYGDPPRVVIWPCFWFGVVVSIFAFHWWMIIWTLAFLVLGIRLPPRWQIQQYELKIKIVRDAKETLIYSDRCPLNPVDYNGGLSDHELAHRKAWFGRSMSRFNAVVDALSAALGRASSGQASV